VRNGWRIAIALSILVVCVPLAVLQGAASLGLRDRAVRGSWVRAVPPAAAWQVERLPAGAPVDGALRVALAREALARRDFAAAGQQIAALGPSRDRLALQAEFALGKGDAGTALHDALAAGDLATIDRLTRALVARGDVSGALAVQEAATARLAADPTQGEALAEAEFRAGRLEEMTAWRYAVGSPVRRAHELAGLTAYTRAVALAPFAVRYLVALGTQALNVNRYALAETSFIRARTVDPTSAEPEAGLGDLALRRGDRAAASAALARARALDPRSSAVGELEKALTR